MPLVRIDIRHGKSAGYVREIISRSSESVSPTTSSTIQHIWTSHGAMTS